MSGFRCVRRGPPGLGYALAFDINNSKVRVPYQAAMNAYPLTLTAWVRTRETNSTYRGIVERTTSSPNTNGYMLVTRYGRVQAEYVRSATQYVRNGTEPLDGGFVADGNWHHVAFVVNAGGGVLYVDGQVGASNAWTGAAGACTLDDYLSIGCWQAIQLMGVLDEVTIWSTNRSQAQIQASMHQRLEGDEGWLLGYWRLDEGRGSTAVNSTMAGASLNGTLEHGPTWVASGVPIAP
jgi:hypothetical protein